MTISWDDIPAAERFELLATIREAREWRYGGIDLIRPLPPIKDAALALYAFRLRSGERTGDAHNSGALSRQLRNKSAIRAGDRTTTQGDFFNDASAN